MSIQLLGSGINAIIARTFENLLARRWILETPRNNNTGSQLEFPIPREQLIALLWAYHDEMKPEPIRLPWSGHGSLLIPEEHRLETFSHLRDARHGYDGELKSTSVKKSSGKKYDVARRWIELFFRDIIRFASYKATFAFHNQSIRLPFPGEEGFEKHWRMSTKANLLGHIRWVLSDIDLVALRPVYDDCGDDDRAALVDGTAIAMNAINQRRSQGKRGYPQTFAAPVLFRSSDHRLSKDITEAIDAELLQFTDVLLGATADALRFRPGSDKNGRRILAAKIVPEIAKRHEYSDLLFHQHQRHFSVSLYPDNRGRMYGANPKRVPRAQLQKALLL